MNAPPNGQVFQSLSPSEPVCGMSVFHSSWIDSPELDRLIGDPKSVIPAYFKRWFDEAPRRVRNWTPDKNIRG